MHMTKLFVASQVVLVLVIASAKLAGASSKPSPDVMRETAGIIALTIGKLVFAVLAIFAFLLGVAYAYNYAIRRNGPVREALRGPIREDEQYTLPVQDMGVGRAQGRFLTKTVRNESGEVDTTMEIRCDLERTLLGSLEHKNIIKLKSYNHREDRMEIVYDLREEEANGCLFEWLHCPSTHRAHLDWPTRRAITMEVAQGIYHMHHGRNNPVIHHNLNSSNILLDNSFKATITGFDLAETSIAGLDQPLPISETRHRSYGNYGYTAPEHGRAMTQKVDVYSFGVLLLEIVSGRVAYQEDGDVLLVNWAHMYLELLNRSNMPFSNSEAVDPDIPRRAHYGKEMAAVFNLGVRCTATDQATRPSMQEVIKDLRKRGGSAWSWRSLFCSVA